jgi:metal-responsive CopG/Arc/MetJ family transcriptional regulator
MWSQTSMHLRINVTLPKETIKLMDRVSKKGDRSRLINEAVKHFIETIGLTNLRRRLEQGASARAGRDLEIAEEWFPADNDLQEERSR